MCSPARHRRRPGECLMGAGAEWQNGIGYRGRMLNESELRQGLGNRGGTGYEEDRKEN